MSVATTSISRSTGAPTTDGSQAQGGLTRPRRAARSARDQFPLEAATEKRPRRCNVLGAVVGILTHRRAPCKDICDFVGSNNASQCPCDRRLTRPCPPITTTFVPLFRPPMTQFPASTVSRRLNIECPPVELEESVVIGTETG